jgi:hypothetical protein
MMLMCDATRKEGTSGIPLSTLESPVFCKLDLDSGDSDAGPPISQSAQEGYLNRM